MLHIESERRHEKLVERLSGHMRTYNYNYNHLVCAGKQ